MSCIHIGGALSPEQLELAKKQKFKYMSPIATEYKRARLTEMSTDSKDTTRAAVAGDPMTPASVVYDLSKDESSLVRAWAARNPRLGMGIILNELRDDPDRGISAYANYRWKQLEDELNNEEHQHGNDGKFPGEVDVDLDN